MFEKDGLFQYKDGETIIENIVTDCYPYGSVLKVHIMAKDAEDSYEWQEICYDINEKKWYIRAWDKNGIFEKFPYEVVKFEYTIKVG